MRGIEFQILNDTGGPYCFKTLKQFDAELAPRATDGAPLVGVAYAWMAIRAHNKNGVIPWVFVDPYDAEINHNGSIQVHVSELEARVAYDASCDEI